MLKDGAKIGWCGDQPLTHIQLYELEVESEYYLFSRVYNNTYLSYSKPTKFIHRIEESYVCYVMNMSMLICQ